MRQQGMFECTATPTDGQYSGHSREEGQETYHARKQSNSNDQSPEHGHRPVHVLLCSPAIDEKTNRDAECSRAYEPNGQPVLGPRGFP